MLSFAAASCLMMATPGPGVLTTAGIGSGFGWNAGIRFLIGLFIGTNLAALLVISGLTAIVLAEPLVRTVLVWASILWFLKLALGIGRSLEGRLLMFDALNMQFYEARIPADPECTACGAG